MNNEVLSQEKLKSILHYDPMTGVFTWKINKWRVYPGMIAGSPHKCGYITIRIGRQGFLAHRLAHLFMCGDFPEGDMDHINHIRKDNRMENLRVVSHSDNMKNKSIYKTNTTGHAGIWNGARLGTYRAQVSINGKKKHLGVFDSLGDAIEARKNAVRNHSFHINHGEINHE